VLILRGPLVENTIYCRCDEVYVDRLPLQASGLRPPITWIYIVEALLPLILLRWDSIPSLDNVIGMSIVNVHVGAKTDAQLQSEPTKTEARLLFSLI
jgi:hypothetical protein